MASKVIPVPFKGAGPFGPIATPTLFASVISGTEIDLTLSYVSPPVPLSYVFESSPNPLGPFVQIGTGTSTTFKHLGLTQNTVYYYRAKVGVVDGRFSSYSTTVVATTTAQAPSAPQNLVATGIDYQTIGLQWDTVSGADSYNVYNGTLFIQNVTSNSAVISSLDSGTTYSFSVSAVSNAFGESALSAPASATTSQLVPTAATISASTQSSAAISVALVTPSQEPVEGVSLYDLRRSIGQNSTFTHLANVGVAGFPYLDTGLNPNTQYNYEVLAYNHDQTATSAVSNISSATTSQAQTGTFTLLHYDTFQTNPLSTSKVTDSSKVWKPADDYDASVDFPIAYSTNHARVGNASARAQLTFTKGLVNGNYTQWAIASPGNSSHRNELNTTGIGPWAPTGWDRNIYMLNEYWYGWSIFIPAPGDPEAFPVTTWPGYLILFQLHDVNVSGANPMFVISMEAPAGQNAEVLGTALRTNWSVTSASRSTADGTGPHTFKKYDLGSWQGDAGEWVDFVFRYKPDFTQYTGVEPPTNCKGIVQLWMSSKSRGEDKLMPLLTTQGQINFPNAGLPNPSGGAPNQAPYAVPFAYYTAWATPGGNPDINAAPPSNYPHQMVQYFGWWKMIQAFGNPQAAVDSTNFAYQLVKTPGNRSAAR